MTEKLFISEDAPAELKEIIKVSQKCLDNMMEFKVKADNGTLTFDDLEELTRRNNLLTDEFPKAEPSTTTGFPTSGSGLDELEAVGNANAAETARLLEQEGGPAYKIDTFDQLKELSQLSPMAIGTLVLRAAEEKRGTVEDSEESEKPYESQDMKLKKEFKNGLMKENLDDINSLLYNAKEVLFDLQTDMTGVEFFEKRLLLNLRTFEGYKQSGIDLLMNILSGAEEDEDLADKKPEAALILATLGDEKSSTLDDLLELLQEDEELKSDIVKALKYSPNPFINEWLKKRLSDQPSDTQASFIEILEYRKDIDSDKWDLVLKKKDPMVSEKIVRAYANAGRDVDESTKNSLLEDQSAGFYEEAVLSTLISGEQSALYKARRQVQEDVDSIATLPLGIACAGEFGDFHYLRKSLGTEKARLSAILAFGILGLVQAVPLLIERLGSKKLTREEWELQKRVVDSLELITGADLRLPLPDIKEGPEGKEYEVTLETGWQAPWFFWWTENQPRFEINVRYRRGRPFTLLSCIEEMEFLKGNHWSRQYSYHELQIRSGQHIAPFQADWYLRDQKESIEKWKEWWRDNQMRYGDSQWLFAGKAPDY